MPRESYLYWYGPFIGSFIEADVRYSTLDVQHRTNVLSVIDSFRHRGGDERWRITDSRRHGLMNGSTIAAARKTKTLNHSNTPFIPAGGALRFNAFGLRIFWRRQKGSGRV